MSSPQAPTPPDELRAKAEAATKGPWYPNNVAATGGVTVRQEGTNRPVSRVYLEDRQSEENGFPWDETQADAQFIAAADPTTILSLLDEIDALRERLDAVREGWGHLTASMNKGNEGAPAWFTVSVEDVAAFDSLLAPTSDNQEEAR